MAKPKKRIVSKLARLGRRIMAPARLGLLQKKESRLLKERHDVEYLAKQVSEGHLRYLAGEEMTPEARKLFSGKLPHPETIKVVIDNELFNLKMQDEQLKRELSAVKALKKNILKPRQNKKS